MPGRDRTARPTGPPRTAHPARVYDWWLGGRDNYVADEELGRGVLDLDPSARRGALANRAFMRRATRYAARRGVRQFLDIGTGIPAAPNLHEIAQGEAPDARIVYTDNDPVILRYAQALLHGTPEGVVDCAHGDVRDPDGVLGQAARSLDLSRPVALSLFGLLHYLDDAGDDDVYALVARYTAALAPGSTLAISQVTADTAPGVMAQVSLRFRAGGMPFHPRSREQVTRFFDGLDVVEPGVLAAPDWHPGLDEDPAAYPPPPPGPSAAAPEPTDPGPVPVLAGLAVKP
ncbi:SAM-dependent methyltransferase [Streptomyces uncialis]|uniref:SAM-dependent methyltransferase n=1 Tax=Streptomyces uncialis TaxID=1048205 RepID=UPI00382F49AA